MRKRTFLLTVLVLALVLPAGVALAATINCNGGGCSGTNRADAMRGTGGFDRMAGRGGNDRMAGSGGGDIMLGEAGTDNINGGFGNDRINGGELGDTLVGGAARDRIVGASGVDTISAGSNDDFVDISGDNQTDSVDCGPGQDTLVTDLNEVDPEQLNEFVRRTSCENVQPR
jgi:Ca2+-binding RTX toxin-like protein